MSQVTGTCECTGVLGPMLGGGHGLLQGRYGLLADNLISARMVLANGTALNVSSDSNPDLFWAICGAGHNFGIVTEFTYKIYDVPENNDWAYESFIFTHDKVEELYTQINILTDNGTQPAELLNWSYFLWLPEVDPNNVRSSSYRNPY
jgi:FAD/FMN-containing dehydrogenase